MQIQRGGKRVKAVAAAVKAYKNRLGDGRAKKRQGIYIEADKERPELTYIITVRYQKDITPDMFIQFKGRLFNIKSIRNIREADEMLEISCTEKIDEKREIEKEER